MPLHRRHEKDQTSTVCFVGRRWCFRAGAKIAPLGDFKLENGQIIRDCRLGYRIFGKLNRDQSNVVLFPTLVYRQH
jgi:homoserine O-acetyltransferase